MKIPKQRAVTAVSDDGTEYIKLVDIRYPVASYLFSLPLKFFRATRFQLQIEGVLLIKKDTSLPKPSSSEGSHTITTGHESGEQELSLGEPEVQPVPFACRYKGSSVSGKYMVRFLLIHPNLEDGTDILEFTWTLDNGKVITTFHLPDYFARQMFADGSGLSGTFAQNISPDVAADFNNHLLIRDSKALMDDRTYADIMINDRRHQVQMHYIGLKISLARSTSDERCVNALVCGVMQESEILPPFTLAFPLALLLDSSSVDFDAVDEEWGDAAQVGATRETLGQP